MTNHLSKWERIRKRFLRLGPKYTTNFVKTKYGNGIPYNSELIVRVRGAEVVTGRVYDVLTKRTYQIDQSHSNDEDNDAETTNFTLRSKSHPHTDASTNYALPIGDYILLTWWWDDDTMRGGTYKDKFTIF